MQQFVHLTPPTEGAAITRRGGELVVPDAPIVPFIEGDGTGPDIPVSYTHLTLPTILRV